MKNLAPGLIYKLKNYVALLTSYRTERTFSFKQ